MINSKDPSLLHPYVKYLHDQCWIKWKAAGLHPTDTSTFRDNEYQDYLYAIGRTTKGVICTYLKGGHSMHNYKLAWDTDFPNDAEHHKAAVIAKSLGLTWGGDFHLKNGKDFVDHPHFEWTGGLTIDDLLKGKKPVDPRVPVQTPQEVVVSFAKGKILSDEAKWLKKAMTDPEIYALLDKFKKYDEGRK